MFQKCVKGVFINHPANHSYATNKLERWKKVLQRKHVNHQVILIDLDLSRSQDSDPLEGNHHPFIEEDSH